MELSTFNPYSGKFAGYNITKGKLTTELHYKVDGRKLDAQHHIIVDQLEFGDKTESKDAVSLPVKLAVALLKDRNGVIDLNLPVTGSLDDPKFRLGPIIWKVFVNILEKAVTAPFALAGILVRRRSGSAVRRLSAGHRPLDPAAVGQGPKPSSRRWTARPQLKIEIPIAVVSELDRPALVEAKFRRSSKRRWQTAAARKKSSAAAPRFRPIGSRGAAGATDAALCQELWRRSRSSPSRSTAIKTKARNRRRPRIDFLDARLARAHCRQRCRSHCLGAATGHGLQQALLTGYADRPRERVFLVANDKAKNQDGARALGIVAALSGGSARRRALLCNAAPVGALIRCMKSR